MALEGLTHPNCPLCLDKGKISYLRLYQINMDEAVYNCENAECIYPYGVRVNASSLIVARKCLDTCAEGKSSQLNRDDEMSQLDEIIRLDDLTNLVDASPSASDFECNLEEILKFIGDPESGITEGLEGSSVEPSSAIG